MQHLFTFCIIVVLTVDLKEDKDVIFIETLRHREINFK